MVEVGIPVYKAKNTLPKTLDSLVAQTRSMFFVCLSIDGDGEDYSDIINEYRHRGLKIRTINKENGGPGIARQRIIDTTQCDYLIFVDSDDMLMPDAIELLYTEAKSNNYDLIFSNFIRERQHSDNIVMDAGKVSITWCHGKIYKVSYLKENNISFIKELDREEDAYFNVIAYNSTDNKAMIKEITYLWRDNKNSLTRSGENSDYFKKTYTKYIYSQVKGMQEIYRIRKDMPTRLFAQTIINIYNHYMKAKYYKLDLTLLDNIIIEFKNLDWVKGLLNNKDIWVYLADNLKAGQIIDNNFIFAEETINKWIERLLK